MEYRFSSVGFYILAGDAISERRKPINSTVFIVKDSDLQIRSQIL
jgi:hypothetical protein